MFRIDGKFIESKRWGGGNVNDTFLTIFRNKGAEKLYIHQRINQLVFSDPEGLMENVCRVTDHLTAKANGCRSLRLIDTPDGKRFARDAAGNIWRAYEYMENAQSPDYAQDLTQAYEAAKAFGAFQRDLIDLPDPPLAETIPEFHHTRKRFDRFVKTVEDDSCGRVKEAEAEIPLIRERRALAEWFEGLQTNGKLPRRVVHNDTKINNVMIDSVTGKAVCVVDLDTVMPGLAASDFGDLARSAAASAVEDERDLSKMFFRLDVFDALTQGYFASASSFLTTAEIDSLPMAPMALTMELAMRFLTDFLEGDVYFKTSRLGHNLDRARAQLKLLSSMENQESKIRRIVEHHAAIPV
ncbi:MAG: aminoglycoside phosphotransferase family protein [Opitutales bacterium]